MKLRRVAGFSGAAIEDFAERSLASDCAVVSDGLACFASVTKAGCTHTVIKTGSGAAGARAPAFKWVNTALGNIKSAITGTYRSISCKHVPRYLAEYQYRFNRRYDLAAMIPRLTWAGVRTVPMPYTLLKLAEDGGAGNSILPAGAPARDGASPFLRRRARRDSMPKMTYTHLP